ncbi:MAG: hypothetical protein WDN24_01710 [Sphingomonas sp.]
MRTIFEAPTIAALAARLDAEAKSGASDSKPRIERLARARQAPSGEAGH